MKSASTDRISPRPPRQNLDLFGHLERPRSGSGSAQPLPGSGHPGDPGATCADQGRPCPAWPTAWRYRVPFSGPPPGGMGELCPAEVKLRGLTLGGASLRGTAARCCCPRLSSHRRQGGLPCAHPRLARASWRRWWTRAAWHSQYWRARASPAGLRPAADPGGPRGQGRPQPQPVGAADVQPVVEALSGRGMRRPPLEWPGSRLVFCPFFGTIGRLCSELL